MERKIGEIFEYNGEWYQCIEEKYCNGCAFRDVKCNNVRNILGYCSVRNRTDKKSVVFKKLEKVGEPYAHHGIIVQKYRIRTTPVIMPNEPYMYFNAINNTIEIEIKQNEDMEEKKLNLKPFDLQKAKEGKPVCTRDGRKARIICFDRVTCDNYSSIVACVLSIDGKDEYPIIYGDDGYVVSSLLPKDDDLMMLPEKKEGWVNVYNSLGVVTFSHNPYDTKEEALANAKPKDYVDTVKITWEE